jgi:DUF1680 family protein
LGITSSALIEWVETLVARDLRHPDLPITPMSYFIRAVFCCAISSCCIASGASPDALTPVPIQRVTIDDGFWSPRLELWRTTTINDAFDKFEQYGGFRNFDRVAAHQSGGHQGENWWDGLIYETIRAAGDFLAAHPDPALHARVQGYVARIAAAAAIDPDGYINTAQQLNAVGYKWKNPPQAGDLLNDIEPHTIYNAGCLVEAGIHLYQATGDTDLLKIATRQANYMCGVMGPSPKANYIPGHALGEEAFVKLYRLYRDEPGLKSTVGLTVNETDFLSLAQFWIENRGNTAGRAATGAYNQDDMSVFLQPTLEGHAVRSELLATGVAAAALENGRSDYRQTVERWWQNMVDARMYLTGGLGAVATQEGFGNDYELPNDGYAETCAASAGGMFSRNMNLLTGDAKYADILERELYNGALAGVSLAGNTYFYTNSLTAGPDHRRWEWAGAGLPMTPCCPPMFLKLNSALPGFIYATKNDSVLVNLYLGSHATIQAGPLDLQLTQTTFYPWDGTVRLQVDPAAASTFSVKLRIPGWAKNPLIQVNGQTQSFTLTKGYASLTRLWNAGDIVTLQLPMPVERIKADSRVKADVGRVALMRGPLVYCFEGLDNNDANKAIQLGATDGFTVSNRPDLLGGMVQLEGRATVIHNLGGTLRKDPVTVRAIPFYANQNRAATTMDVWVADDTLAIRPVSEGVPSASYCNPGDTVKALNDGVVPRLSDDESVPRMTWWDHKGTSEWAQVVFPTARAVSSADVYWWDERRVNRECRVPQSWSVQYLNGSGQWTAVQGASTYGTAMDVFNHVNFQSVQTTGIRIVAQLQTGWSAGIMEMFFNNARAVPSASYTNSGDTVVALNDGMTPSASDDESIARHTFWNHKGTAEWAQLTFPSAKRLSSLEVYWWDERRVNRECRVPQSWTVQYLNGSGQWVAVTGASPYGTAMDAFNTVRFNEIETTAIRVAAQLQAGWSAGILEMRAYEPSLATPYAQWLVANSFSPSTPSNADPDNDGVPILTAYALGLDPRLNPAASMPRPYFSSGGLSLSFWGGRDDVLYSAEQSNDLKIWQSAGVIVSPPNGTGIRTVTVPDGTPSGFVRLVLSKNPE